MLYWVIGFLVAALAASLTGVGGITLAVGAVAKLVFAVFAILLV